MNPKTQEILAIFSQIAAVPRPSKKEAKISSWLQDWAKSNGFAVKTDPLMNVVIEVPASPGYEAAPKLVLQGHMDMVCDKYPQVDHDFERDPIRPVIDGDWLRADGTTLGADNGIGMALGLTAALDKDLAHPPLELLFTVDEEVSMTGARNLPVDLIEGRLLLNIDGEEDGVFLIGCAGGINTHVELPLTRQPLPAGFQSLRLQVSGLQGGHSGIDISSNRGNAIRLLTRLLFRLRQNLDLQVLDLKAGSASNAIPRQAWAEVALPPAQQPALEQIVSEFEKIAVNEFSATEQGIAIQVVPVELDAQPGQKGSLVEIDTALNLLQALPHGVAEMSAVIPNFVETSNNLAVMEIKEERLHLVSSQRSSVASRLDELTGRIHAVAALAGAVAYDKDDYPGWQPDINSPLLVRSREVFKRTFDREPEVKAIHAGLECGFIASKIPEMDMVSFGPTLQMPHSPTERLYIPSLENAWMFLTQLFKSFA